MTAPNKDRDREKYLAYKANSPAAHHAHKLVRYALETGRISKQPCERCGATEKVDAHHEDYLAPLDVTWLCRRHHLERHEELKLVGGPKNADAPVKLRSYHEVSEDLRQSIIASAETAALLATRLNLHPTTIRQIRRKANATAPYAHRKLRSEDIRKIRTSTKSIYKLAQEYGMSRSAMWCIVHGVTYQDVAS